MEAADGVSPGGLHTSPNHAVHLLFHLRVSPLHSPEVQVTGVVSLHLWERMAQLSAEGLGAPTPHLHTGPGEIMESAPAALPTYLYRRSSSAPHSNPVNRTPDLHNIHACEEGGKTQNTEEVIKRSVRMKKCEDEGQLILG